MAIYFFTLHFMSFRLVAGDSTSFNERASYAPANGKFKGWYLDWIARKHEVVVDGQTTTSVR